MVDTRLDDFAKWLAAFRATRTRETHERAARVFEAWRLAQGRTYDDPGVAAAYAQHLAERGLMRASCATYLAGVRRWLDWLDRQGEQVARQHPAELPTHRVRKPFVPPEDRLADYDRACRELDEPYRTLLLLLPRTGLRIGEACVRLLSDVRVHAANGSPATVALEVHKAKRAKERTVPLTREAVAILRPYLSGWRATARGGGAWLFPAPGRHASTAADRPVSPKYIQKVVREQLRPALGLWRLTPHALRRMCGTMLHRRSVPEHTIAAILGHEDVGTLKPYIDVAPDEMADAMERMSSPRGERHE